MSYVYPKAAQLAGHAVMGNHQCVWLVQNLAHAPHTSKWREGARVRGLSGLAPGTAIATFFDGRYPSRPHGNHAAFYLGQDACGLWVVDQWLDPHKRRIERRLLAFVGQRAVTSTTGYVNIGDHYAVIE